jgi:hypothetical protein
MAVGRAQRRSCISRVSSRPLCGRLNQVGCRLTWANPSLPRGKQRLRLGFPKTGQTSKPQNFDWL